MTVENANRDRLAGVAYQREQDEMRIERCQGHRHWYESWDWRGTLDALARRGYTLVGVS